MIYIFKNNNTKCLKRVPAENAMYAKIADKRTIIN